MPPAIQPSPRVRLCMLWGAALLLGLTTGCTRQAWVRPAQEPGPRATNAAQVVPRGTLAGAQLTQTLSTSRSRPGDRFTVQLLDPLVDGTGEEVIGRGAVLEGVVVDADTSAMAGDAAQLDLRILGVRRAGEGVEALPLEVASTPIELQGTVGRSTLGGLAGAAVGAGTGLAIDREEAGLVLGAALIGAGVGALATYLFAPRDAELPSGSILNLRVREDMVVTRPVAGNRDYRRTPRPATAEVDVLSDMPPPCRAE